MVRPLESAWPVLVNSTGQPGTGTGLAKEHFDQIRSAIDGAIYDPGLEDGPPGIIREVVEARAGKGSLDARLRAVEATAAGGAAVSASGGGSVNLVPNDTMLIWSAGESAAPDYWTPEAGLAITREPTTFGSSQSSFVGRNAMKISNTSGVAKNVYLDVVSVDEMSLLSGPELLKSLKVAAGVMIHTGSTNLVQVHIDDGVTALGANTMIGGNYDVAGRWVWSADPATLGGYTMPATATRFRLVVRLTGNGVAFIQCPAAYFAPTAERWTPAPCRMGTMVFGVESTGAIAAGDRCAFSPAGPIHIRDARLRCTTAPATANLVAEVFKDGSAIFGAALQIAVTGLDSGVKVPTSRVLASLSSANVLRANFNANGDTATRGAYLAVRFLEFPRFLNGAFLGA